MGVDQTSLDRIRNATFPSSRRGYDKREVEKFLARLADWLETGAGDESRSDTVKRELERVGQRTGAILAQAEESAQQIRGEAEEEARQAIAEANSTAEQTRAEADAYAKETRSAADEDSKAVRADADQSAAETVEQAQAQARRIVEEGNKRRQDIESVIADLVDRRDAVLGDIEELSGKLTGAVADHRPPDGADPFDLPAELDPLAEDGEPSSEEIEDAVVLEEEGSPEEEPDEEPAEPSPAGDEAGGDIARDAKRRTRRKQGTKKKKTLKSPRGSRSGRVKT
jgi:DivIVA domain-containing protein